MSGEPLDDPLAPELRWVITAPPRSGTTWVARWLTDHGFLTSHERVLLLLDEQDPLRLNLRRIRWPGESSYLAAPFCDELRAMGVTIIHQRRPLEDVANSMMRLNWDLFQDTHFGLATRTFAPHVAEIEPKTFDYYYEYARTWESLIKPDHVWDLYDDDENKLRWMIENLGQYQEPMIDLYNR